MNGIKEYLTKTDGVGGEIKRKIMDFKVQEISPEGKTLPLKAFSETEKIFFEKKWPSEVPADERKKNQLHVEMEKYNYDTFKAIKIVSRSIGASPKRIGFAGMKDKRAVTVQRISIWKPCIEKLKNFNSRYIDLRNAFWSDERIELGSLKGNHFQITIRNIELSEEETEKRIKKCILEIQKQGVLNYFGFQRFGGIRNITAEVGKMFLQEKPKEAVLHYLCKTVAEEDEETFCARKKLEETLDFGEALKSFPKKLRFERAILNHLKMHQNDYVNAFHALPKSMRYMFLHAYQSYLFNEYINKRIENKLSLSPVEGDETKNGVVMGPLFGYELKLAQGEPGKIEEELLAKQKIFLEQFRIKQVPEMSSRGERRPILFHPENLVLEKTMPDELNEEKTSAVLSFDLPKGTYATIVLREIMKKNAV
jgi:tRNA pseudouridine13 synthase